MSFNFHLLMRKLLFFCFFSTNIFCIELRRSSAETVSLIRFCFHSGCNLEGTCFVNVISRFSLSFMHAVRPSVPCYAGRYCLSLGLFSLASACWVPIFIAGSARGHQYWSQVHTLVGERTGHYCLVCTHMRAHAHTPF